MMASYNIMSSGRRGWSTQSWLLFIYSAVVTFALVLVVSRNFETPEQIVAEERLAAEGKRENAEQQAVAKMAVPEVYEGESDGLAVPGASGTAAGADMAGIDAGEGESFDNPAVEWTVEGEETQPEVKQDVLTVEKGDHFIGLLQKLGMEYQEANQAAESLKEAGYDVRNLRAGQKIDIVKTVDVPFGELLSVDKIVIEPTAGTKYVVTRNEDEKYVAEMEQLELKTENQTAQGSITSSLAAAMQNAGVPSSIIGNFINIFAYTVDFRSDIKSGDTFKVLFDRKVAPDGKVVKNGDILYAELNLGRDKIALYRYEDLNGGVDYAAPKGTRIYASADGVVKRAQWAGGYGRYVVIRHNSEFSTGYAHMNGFAKGIRPGVRVKQGQVIGYVGSTGRSTGPHLHFEVIKNGKKVDPLKVKAATGTNLAGKDLQRFKAEVAKIAALAEGQTAYAAADTAAAESLGAGTGGAGNPGAAASAQN